MFLTAKVYVASPTRMRRTDHPSGDELQKRTELGLSLTPLTHFLFQFRHLSSPQKLGIDLDYIYFFTIIHLNYKIINYIIKLYSCYDFNDANNKDYEELRKTRIAGTFG